MNKVDFALNKCNVYHFHSYSYYSLIYYEAVNLLYILELKVDKSAPKLY